MRRLEIKDEDKFWQEIAKTHNGISLTSILNKINPEEIRTKYETEGHPYYSSARLWDDGVIDPRDTRDVLIQCLEVIACSPVSSGKFGLFRM